MALIRYRPTTAARRFYTVSDYAELSQGEAPSRKRRPHKALLAKQVSTGGRNCYGRQTNINRGGGHKRRYRMIDFSREKQSVPAVVASIEYDPNRSARVALLKYRDGERRYILAPIGLKVGDTLVSGSQAEVKTGNALPLRSIPTGVAIHNIAVSPKGSGRLVRSAGVAAELIAKEGEYALLRLPSGEVRKLHLDCFATIGQVGNLDHQNRLIGKAGRSRWMGRRPHNRGTSKNPVDHPLGGGEGKSKGGRHPCSPTGVNAKGLKTRNNKRTDKFIVRRRRQKG